MQIVRYILEPEKLHALTRQMLIQENTAVVRIELFMIKTSYLFILRNS